MPDTLYALTPEAMDRLTQLRLQVAWIASQLGLTIDGMVNPGERNYQTVRISSGTLNGDGTYSGYYTESTSGTFADQSPIRILPATGVTLTTGKQYLGYFSHHDETNSVGVFIVPNSAESSAGYSGTVTHYRYTWNATTCAMTETSQTLTYANGELQTVGSWV